MDYPHYSTRINRLPQRQLEKKRCREENHSQQAFDPLAFLDDADEDSRRSKRPTVNSDDRTTSARRRVHEWLGQVDLDGDIDDLISEAPLMAADETTPDDSEIGEAQLDDQNTLSIVQDIISQELEEGQPTLEQPELFGERAVKLIEEAEDAEANDAGIDDIEREDTSTIRESTQTLSAVVSHQDDNTLEVIHQPQELTLSTFHTALGIWENHHGISRDAHAQLVEIFQLATSIEDVKSTPRKKDTIFQHIIKSLPLRKLRKATINLDYKVLPSRTKLTEDILVFDIGDLVSAMLSSPLLSHQIYQGPAHLVNGSVTKPWEANWWGESIRSTSGFFYSYPDGTPIFPSDFVKWKCLPGQCRAGLTDCELHVGRIRWCGLDWTHNGGPGSSTVNSGEPTIIVQTVLERATLPEQMVALLSSSKFSHRTTGSTELIIVEDEEVFLAPSQIMVQIPDVLLDYYYDPEQTRIPGPLTSPFSVRLVFNAQRQEFRPLKLSSPHRAELEIQTYGRQYLRNNFAARNVISLPFQMFIDGFGLYRNMYRSLMGIYLTPEFFPPELRNRRASVYPLTLGPHGAELADVLKTLLHSRSLDRGMEMNINGSNVFVCSFVHCIIGDMPSQQKLSGCQGPTAKMNCRNCMVDDNNKPNLEYDIINKGRYHFQTLIARKEIDQAAKSMSAKKVMLNKIGLHEDLNLFNTVTQLFPALDIIRSRPTDAAHSEYQGLSRLIHQMLFKENMTILTSSATDEACAVYQSFTVPPGWGRLQSPKRHIDSWRMQELARGIIILPFLLRCWLQPCHIRDDCRRIIVQIAPAYLDASDFPVPTQHFTAVDWIICAVWAFTKSVFALFSRSISPRSLHELRSVIISGRKAVQFFCQINADLSRQRAVVRQANRVRSARSSPLGRTILNSAPNDTLILPNDVDDDSSSVASVASGSSQASGKRRRADPQDKCNTFLNMKGLPNIHSGLHHTDIVREYGACSLVWTLLGEDKHRFYKSLITTTNHRDAAATLIIKENIRQTLAFTFAGSFEHVTPEFHRIIHTINHQCPTFARAVDPRSLYTESKSNGDESNQVLEQDDLHKSPLASHRFSLRIIQRRQDSMLNITELRNLDPSSGFVAMLRRAHRRDYGNIVMEFGFKRLTWWKKVAFTDSSGDRICFSVGNFIRVRDDSPAGFTVARLDGLFVHERISSSWLFLVVSFTARCYRGLDVDYLLRCPLYELSGDRDIIGLPRVNPQKIWMVPGHNESLILVDHDVYFM
ncbi:hypothetical protein F5Y01DRAFT_325814 [Xylaria sp. FL0043]|nr:hypothetical protein F5Y01DRAFT_325814 [Xylaria sp. FL0043]